MGTAGMVYDLAVLVALAWFTWRGSSKGFVWQSATIAALVLAFCFAGPASAVLAPRLGLKAPLDRWVSMLVLYAICSFVCFLLARWLRKGIEKIDLEHYDSHLGAIVGFVKGGVLCLLVTFFAVTLVPESHPYVLGSHSGYASAVVFDQLRPVVPDEFHGYLEESLEKLEQGRAEVPGTNVGEDDRNEPAKEGDEPVDPNDPTTIIDRLLDALPQQEAMAYRDSIQTALAVDDETLRARRLDELREATPESIADLVDTWRNALTPAEQERRKNLLFEIVAVYTPFPAAQQSIADEVAAQLRGVPPRVQLGVVEDWHADLLAPDADPDPETSPLTSLDQRINRQLVAASVPLESLDQALQDRLRTWR